MDSNLSLLEIAGEDDSLLQIPRDDSGVNNSSIFSCSPLHCFRSLPPQTEGRVGAVDVEKLSSSPQNGLNKENCTGNKSEAPKLNVEPQQMKRKKKGGGYNLRKSLAWDRAFFTEEGVLNPLELSMISGNHSRTNKELAVIHEEEENTLVGEADISDASLELQEIEENLFKQLSEDRKNGTCLSPKSDALSEDTSASTSLAKRKVLAVNDIHRTRSKGNACPRPVASSSLKRPDMAKAQSRESKVSKIPVLKPKVPVIKTTARSGASSADYSKRNQNAHSAAKVLKSAGVIGLSKNLRSLPINAKFDVADKCSVSRTLTRQAGKYFDNSISETYQPPRSQHQPVTETSKGLEVHPPQGVCNPGEKKRQTPFQTAKPSGLRMPSPSLGFFSQQKASNSHSVLHKSSKPCKPAESYIPKSKKVVANSFHEARIPHAPRKSSEIVNDAAKNCTPKSSLSDLKSEPSLTVQNKQKATVEVQSYSLDSEDLAEKEEVKKFVKHVNKKSLEQVEPYKSENASNTEGMEFCLNDKKLLLVSDMNEQLDKKVHYLLEHKLHDVLSNEDMFVFQEPHSMHHSSMQRTLTGKDNLSSIAQNAMKQEVDGKMKPLVCNGQISNESQLLRAKHDTSSEDIGHFGDFKEYNCMNIALINSNPCFEQVKNGVGECDKYGGDAQVHLLNANLSVDCNNTPQRISEAANQHIQCFHNLDESLGEQFETSNRSTEGEISLKSNDESHVNSCLVHVTTLSSQESPEKPSQEIIGTCGIESKIAEMEDCRHPGDGQSDFIHRRPVDDDPDQLIGSKLMQDRTCDDCTTVSTTACSPEVKNVSLEGRSSYENIIEHQHFTSQLCQMKKANCGSRGNDMPVNNGCNISELQVRDDSSSRVPSLHCDMLIAQHDGCGDFEQQAELLTSCKMNNMLCENESSVANDSHLLDDSDSIEVSADINSNTKVFTGNGAESSSGLLEYKLLVQANRELDYTKKGIEVEDLDVKDALVMSLDENLVTCSCNNNPNTPVTKDQFSLVVDSVNMEPHLLELQRSSLVADVDFQHDNHKLYLNGDLLPAKTACSEEIGSENLFEGVLEQCNDYASAYNTSNHFIQVTSEIKVGSLDVDERTECLQMDGADEVSAEVAEVELHHKVNATNLLSFSQGSEDQTIDVVDWKCNERCSLSESLKLQVADNMTFHGRIPQGSEVTLLKRKSLSEEAENRIFGKAEISITNVKNQITEDSSEIIHLKKSGTKRKQEVPTVMPPPNAAPFSDEWLAAMVAAGEEILTMKGGAVQNSPPDKPQNESGPWSPVKRKNQAIGPYDCTKYTNINIPDSSS